MKKAFSVTFSITDAQGTQKKYRVKPLSTDPQVVGRAWRFTILSKSVPEGSEGFYDVWEEPGGSLRCQCLGAKWLHCKHMECLAIFLGGRVEQPLPPAPGVVVPTKKPRPGRRKKAVSEPQPQAQAQAA